MSGKQPTHGERITALEVTSTVTVGRLNRLERVFLYIVGAIGAFAAKGGTAGEIVSAFLK